MSCAGEVRATAYSSDEAVLARRKAEHHTDEDGTFPSSPEQNDASEIVPELYSPPSKRNKTLKLSSCSDEKLQEFLTTEVVSRRLLHENLLNCMSLRALQFQVIIIALARWTAYDF